MDMSDEKNRMMPELTGRMSRATVLAAQQEWMPGLLSEVPAYRQGIKPPRRPPPAPAPPPATQPSPTKPAQQSGDDILDSAPPPAAPKDKKSGGGDDSILDTSEILPAAKPPAPAAKPSVPADDDLSKATVPSTNPKTPSSDSGNPHSKPTDAAPPKAPSNVQMPADFWVNPLYNKPAKGPVKEPPQKKAPAAEVMAPEDWMATGGWYRPLKSFTLLYRPVGHADPFFTAWLTTLAGMSNDSSGNIARAAFRKLADPEAPGACMKCHTVDGGNGALQVNWLPARPEPNAHPFTAFNHTAHFSLLTDQGCQTCHRLAPESEYPKFFMPTDGALPENPHMFASNFAPLSKELCAECHKPQAAGDNCLLCHRYHTGIFAAELKSPFSKHGSSAANGPGP
jgi:hypothetical protein